MKKKIDFWNVPVTWQVNGFIRVPKDTVMNFEDAIVLVEQNLKNCSLPCDGTYLNDSFELDNLAISKTNLKTGESLFTKEISDECIEFKNATEFFDFLCQNLGYKEAMEQVKYFLDQTVLMCSNEIEMENNHRFRRDLDEILEREQKKI